MKIALPMVTGGDLRNIPPMRRYRSVIGINVGGVRFTVLGGFGEFCC